MRQLVFCLVKEAPGDFQAERDMGNMTLLFIIVHVLFANYSSHIKGFWVLTIKALPNIVFAVAWPCKLFTYSCCCWLYWSKSHLRLVLPFHVVTLMTCVASTVPCDEQSVWLNLWADVTDENH